MKRELTEIEIVAIGDELLSGATIDLNAAVIARTLEPLGLRVTRKTTVGDVPEAIAAAVETALQRAGAAITTGGLGPTQDDVTMEAVAGVFGRGVEFRKDLWQALEARWARRGRAIPESNRKQVEVPAGAEVFPNPRGTAPGLAVEDDRLGICVLLPGPPHEMENILRDSVAPYLGRRVGSGARRPFRRIVRTAGIAESAIAERVGDRLADLAVDVAFLPEVDCNDIRLTAWGENEDETSGALDEAVDRVRRILGSHIYAEEEIELAEAVGVLLRERGLTVAVAESCTAGLIAGRLTEPAGASDYLWGGMVVYDDKAKVELLGVSEDTLARHGAVSEETVREMAEGACRRSGADAVIAVTGIAGPTGGTDEKPVGTVWLAVRLGASTVTALRHYPGTRDMVRMRAAQGGLDLLRRTVLEELR
jgi:nicotinamide-nucleotide amidase